ncbi:hypothetical protein CYLTODRAFT_334989, partial [Cylindrobasidium torrendii FP15055 ss-10]
LICADSSSTLTLDGLPFHRPEGIYATIARIPQLPLFREVLIATFKSGHEGWKRFIAYDDPIWFCLTLAQKAKAHMLPTNNANEGAAGTLKRAKQRAPNAKMSFIRSKTMYTRNKTKRWLTHHSTNLSAQLFAHARSTVRRKAKLGLDRAQ